MNFPSMSRRQALGFGASLAASIAGARSISAAPAMVGPHSPANGQGTVWQSIEAIIGAPGTFSNGVFRITVERKDIQNVMLHNVPITPAFQINGDLIFEQLSDGSVMVNADSALKPAELDPFLDQLVSHGITFQAEHQHFYDFQPNVFFIHFRNRGNPTDVATGIKAALSVTSTPFPQSKPSIPTTSLPAAEIGQILGASPDIGSDGVVTYHIPRKAPVVLGGLRVNPYLNVETNIPFQLLGPGRAAAAPDFGMVASEVNAVVKNMRRQSWDVGCLYNQETDENPQLYFSHQFKTGNPLQLAHEIRSGLDLMDVSFR